MSAFAQLTEVPFAHVRGSYVPDRLVRTAHRAIRATPLSEDPRSTASCSIARRDHTPAATDIRGYCKSGIVLKHTRRRLTRLGVTSEMDESGRSTAVSCR